MFGDYQIGFNPPPRMPVRHRDERKEFLGDRGSVSRIEILGWRGISNLYKS